ncbi:MAG: TrkH family potassium uptake protein [candidate division Zixibacteria bacterium]|nr:TrkH family potassium uptake protein [candidate division Zixibacteria bacterium]NIX57158.1 TrkH family potassium uptake protein [candidate division Zixibacteria bacterium]
MNYRAVSYLLGSLIIGASFFMATSLLWAFFVDGTQTITSMSVSSVICFVVGFLLRQLGKNADMTFHAREAVAIVTLGWLSVSILGAIPFILEGVLVNPIDAFFETVSGFTTTGSTVITDLNVCSKALLYWRALTQWLGGMGIIVLFIAILPQLGIGAKHMFKSEVPGPITEGLKPKLKHTAGVLWAIYAGITAAEIIALLLAGMNFHDSVCHSLTCMATGGFSPRNESIAFYQNPAIEIIIIVFMILAGINFSIYYLILRKKIGEAASNAELKVYLSILAVASFLIAINTFNLHDGVLNKIIKPAFQAVSMLTTTGFATEDSNLYPSFAKIIMVALMFIGGSAGSTGGGMKVSRVIIVVKAGLNHIHNSFQPYAVRVVKMGKRPIDETVVKEVLMFFSVYVFLFLLGSAAMTLIIPYNEDHIVTSFTATIACFANIGPGFGDVGATENFAFIPGAGKVILALMMIIGRLELFTALVLFIPAFWKK